MVWSDFFPSHLTKKSDGQMQHIVQTLKIQMHTSKNLWSNAVLCACHLISRMSSFVLLDGKSFLYLYPDTPTFLVIPCILGAPILFKIFNLILLSCLLRLLKCALQVILKFKGDIVVLTIYSTTIIPKLSWPFSSLFRIFFSCLYPINQLSSFIQHAFECTYFVQNVQPGLNKLSPRSVKPVFVGYLWYSRFDIVQCNYYTSADMSFLSPSHIFLLVLERTFFSLPILHPVSSPEVREVLTYSPTYI